MMQGRRSGLSLQKQLRAPRNVSLPVPCCIGVTLGCMLFAVALLAFHHPQAMPVTPSSHGAQSDTRDVGRPHGSTKSCPQCPTCGAVASSPAPPCHTFVDLADLSIKDQLRYKFAKLPRIKDIPPGSDMFLTFSNGHYSNLMLNAAALVADLGYPIVVLAFDNATAEICIDYGLPYMWSDVRMDTADFRQDRSKFLLMGTQKPLAVVKLFDDVKARTVALIDTDTIWLRDPFPWLANHPEADMFVTTDCLSHFPELTHHVVPRCGHVPGGPGHGWALNTGITIWRNTPGTRSFARQWRELMSSNDLHARGMDDQFSFNVIMTSEEVSRSDGHGRGKIFPLRRVASDQRVFYAAHNDSVKLMVLPSAVFAGGKTMWYNHMPTKYGMSPYVVHATFQRYNNNGKQSRFREAMAYLIDPPEYYREGNFLVYDNLVLEFLAAVESLSSKPLNLLYKHFLASTYQLAAFRDAAAMAKALDRILILPKVWAYCDSDHSPTVLANCTFEGAEQHAPWRAPGDLYFNMDVLEGSKFLQWREYNFLDNPRTPRTLRWSQTSIWYHFPSETIPPNYATGEYVHALNESSLRAAASQIGARVLRIQNMQPGSFLGFNVADRNAGFDRWWRSMMNDVKWCCLSQHGPFKEAHYDSIFFPPPAQFSGGAAASMFQVPVLQRPSWCTNADIRKIMEQEGSRPFSFGMHPCNFLEDPPTLPKWDDKLWSTMRHLREQHRIHEDLWT